MENLIVLTDEEAARHDKISSLDDYDSTFREMVETKLHEEKNF